ncbi:flagellar basal body-associated FliL family protein [Thermomonas sp. S9]|uniref:flagellar basal body-associated FliL family protein n=1 Tax=Thermomonas sp. S9 TaxID=2885203 RepID=UPI00216AE686|nr:flagellar basal body-associated FliL family protein [Thermomonas sp. S9]MCR6496386.1 flagellar basal body-associated FliL family protein [Thermomonas sp. S9]
MAAPAKPAPATAAPATNPPPKKSGKLLWIILILVVLAAGGGAAFFFMKPAHSGPKPLPPAQYIAMDPAFVVNLADADTVKYLQADVQLQTRDADTAAAIALHTPLIRNRLLLLFGQQTSQQLAGRAGKERLQAQALNEVRSVLKAQHAADKVDALLFTSVVIQ